MVTFVRLGIGTLALTGAAGPGLTAQMVKMTFAHDLIPQIGRTRLAGATVFAVTRTFMFALIAMALSLAHWLGAWCRVTGVMSLRPKPIASGQTGFPSSCRRRWPSRLFSASFASFPPPPADPSRPAHRQDVTACAEGCLSLSSSSDANSGNRRAQDARPT